MSTSQLTCSKNPFFFLSLFSSCEGLKELRILIPKKKITGRHGISGVGTRKARFSLNG